MRATASAAALTGAFVLAGCGGGGSPPPRRHVHLTAFERHGKTLFVQNCGACHTLADAHTSGVAGPALNEPWAARRVRETIADGPGQMPVALLSGRAAAEVAAYVAAATGGSP